MGGKSWIALVLALAIAPAATVARAEGPPHPDAVAALRDTQIFFRKSSAYLREAEHAKLELLAIGIGRLPGEIVRIHGMSDPYGDAEFNANLRDRRSAAVHAKLLELGLDASSVQLGEPRQPVRGSGESRAEMRRVEFSIEGISMAAAGDADDVEEADGGGGETFDGLADADRAAGGTGAVAEGPPDPASLAVVRDTQIFFPKSSNYLRKDELAKIESLAQALRGLPAEILLIRGMTDPHGDAEFNAWLRQQRSEAVHKTLVSLGIPGGRLGYAAPRGSAVGAAKPSAQELRRVEFAIAGLSLDGAQAVANPLSDADPDLSATPAPAPARFANIGRRDRYRLAELTATAKATKVYFEFSGFRVRTDYHRELWSLANTILESDDGAVSIRGFASPNLPLDQQGQIANRRCLSAASTLQQMGVGWRRIRIEDEAGEIEPGGRPSWLDHRVEFTAIRSLPPLAPGDVADEVVATDEPSEAELEVSVAGSADPFATLVAGTVVYFGGNSAAVRSNDKKRLKRIAGYATKDGESRSIAVRAVTDRWGNKDYNRALGRRRQAAVIRVLTESGIPAERVSEAEIQVTTDGDGGPSWKQRRAELLLR